MLHSMLQLRDTHFNSKDHVLQSTFANNLYTVEEVTPDVHILLSLQLL